jgi:hypothetical protein
MLVENNKNIHTINSDLKLEKRNVLMLKGNINNKIINSFIDFNIKK